MKKTAESRGRGKNVLNSDSTQLNSSNYSKLILSTLMTLPILLPALFSSCIADDGQNGIITENRLMNISVNNGSRTIHELDIFTFNNDTLRQLDSYMRFSSCDNGYVSLSTQNGSKIVFACANSQRSAYEWAEINSRAAMDKICADLRYENPESPLMTGEAMIEATHSGEASLKLQPLMSEIILRSVRCDFTGIQFKGSAIRNAKVYLTNVNSRCSITAEGSVLPSHIVNGGGLNMEDTEEFNYPEMLLQKLDTDITDVRLQTDISLFCYPSAAPEESPGTPYTRLVLEGEINGTTYWWPLNINRDENCEEKGIYRNRRYIYDLTILRPGSSDPDAVIEKESAEIKMETRPWDEKEEYSVYF